MKRIVFFILAVLSISFIACKNDGQLKEMVQDKNDGQLKEMVQEMNKICPIPMGEWLTIENVTYDNNTVTMTYIVQEGFLDFDGVRANEEAFRNNTLMGYANNTEQGFNMFLDAIINAKANMCMVYKSKDGNSYSMQFTYDELKANRAGDNADPEALLKTMVDNARLQTPQIVDEGLIMTDVTIDAKYYTYVYSCDESNYDIDYMKENLGMVKEEILNGLSENNYIMKRIVELLKSTNRGIAYKYVGSVSGKECTIFIDPSEL